MTAVGTRRRAIVGVAVIVAGLGFLLVQALSEATVYFRTADEAVADRRELRDRRFRVEGEVVEGSVRSVGEGVHFVIRGQRETVAVRHQGDPPELFREGLPVVLEGRWDGSMYASDRILVRHTTEYRAKNPERVKDYPSESGDAK